MRPWAPSVRTRFKGSHLAALTNPLIALCLVACAPRGPAALPDSARLVIDAVEQALAGRDFATAHGYVDFRYRLEESLGDLWRGGPEAARGDLVLRLEEMFDQTSDAQRERYAGKPMVREVQRRQGRHLWVESRPAASDGDATGEKNQKRGTGFAWHYRLTPRGTSWAITQREYQVDGMPSDSTRFWPMARNQIAEKYGRQPTLSELAANLPTVMGTMRIRRLKVPALDGSGNPERTMP